MRCNFFKEVRAGSRRGGKELGTKPSGASPSGVEPWWGGMKNRERAKREHGMAFCRHGES